MKQDFLNFIIFVQMLIYAVLVHYWTVLRIRIWNGDAPNKEHVVRVIRSLSELFIRIFTFNKSWANIPIKGET